MTPNHSPASPPVRAGGVSPALPTAGLDLDAQIEQLEQRLVEREAWVRSTAESLAHRARVAVTPKPWVLPVVGVGVVLWLGWRLWHRRDPGRHVNASAPASATGSSHRGEIADLPWAGLTALGWPLMPLAWRERMSPAAATAVVGTVLSIGRRLFRRRVR
jgi:hypothetical protein